MKVIRHSREAWGNDAARIGAGIIHNIKSNSCAEIYDNTGPPNSFGAARALASRSGPMERFLSNGKNSPAIAVREGCEWPGAYVFGQFGGSRHNATTGSGGELVFTD